MLKELIIKFRFLPNWNIQEKQQSLKKPENNKIPNNKPDKLHGNQPKKPAPKKVQEYDHIHVLEEDDVAEEEKVVKTSAKMLTPISSETFNPFEMKIEPLQFFKLVFVFFTHVDEERLLVITYS